MIDKLDAIAIRFYNWCIITCLVCCGSILYIMIIFLGYDNDTKFTEIIDKVRDFVMEILKK